MRWTLVAVALLAVTALAGCSGDDDGDGGGEGTTSSGTATTSASGSTSSRSTTTGTASANRPPTGSLSVSANGTTAAFNLTGSDPDGDDLSWDLDFGDGNSTDGTTLPFNVTHEFRPGNYTANLTLSDGEATASFEVSFAITAAGAGGAPSGGTQDAEVEYTLGQGFCNGDYPAGAEGLVYGVLAIDAATQGAAFTATWSFTAPGSLGVQVVFIDAAGANVGEAAEVLVTELAGEVPAGAVTAWFSDCGAGGPATVTYHAG